MNFLNSFLEKTTKQNIIYGLAVAGTGYIIKSTYELLALHFKEKNLNKEINLLIENEKSKLSPEMNSKPTPEFCFYLYFKILNTVYVKEVNNFNKMRLQIFNTEEFDLERYVNLVENYLKNLKYCEFNILQMIYEKLQIDITIYDTFKYDKLDTDEIKKKYYTDLEIEIPKELVLEKLFEVINVLFDRTKYYLLKLREQSNYNEYLSDKLQILAEYMAFDYIFLKYNYERELIEKAIIVNNLSILEK